MSLWDDLQTSVETQIQKALPAVEASAEQKGIDMLTQLKQGASQTATPSAAAVLNRPTDPNSFFSQLTKNLPISPALQPYAPALIAGALAIGLVSIFMFGGKHG